MHLYPVPPYAESLIIPEVATKYWELKQWPRYIAKSLFGELRITGNPFRPYSSYRKWNRICGIFSTLNLNHFMFKTTYVLSDWVISLFLTCALSGVLAPCNQLFYGIHRSVILTCFYTFNGNKNLNFQRIFLLKLICLVRINSNVGQC